MIQRLVGTKISVLLLLSVALNFYFIQRRLDVQLAIHWRDTRTLSRHASTGNVVRDQRTKTLNVSSVSSHHTQPPIKQPSNTITNQTPHLNRKNETETKKIQEEDREGDRAFLAVAIMSAPRNVDRRNVIRKTWKNGYEGRAHYVKFVIATKNLTTDLLESIKDENDENHDLVLLEDLIDSYKNLTHKLLATLKWLDENVDYSYLFKCDDDTFALLDKLEDDLIKRDHSRSLYWGYFLPDSKPSTEGLWEEHNWKFCDCYFPYAYGGGYLLSSDVIHRITSSLQPLILYNNEDVSVGAWTAAYDMERRHDVRFNTEAFGGDCKNSFIVTHKQGVNDTLIKDELYRKSGLLCAEETSNRWEYEYNWNKLPSRAYS